MDDVRRFDAVQDHVHDRDDVSEGFLFLAVEGAGLKRGEVFGGEVALGLQVIKRLAQEARRADRAVVDAPAERKVQYWPLNSGEVTKLCRFLLPLPIPKIRRSANACPIDCRTWTFGMDLHRATAPVCHADGTN